MFEPSRDQVRALFFETWRKYRAGMPLAGLENLVLDIALLHPEYHELLGQPERYREKDYTGESNPFLQLVWRSQKNKTPPDAGFYLECLRKRAG